MPTYLTELQLQEYVRAMGVPASPVITDAQLDWMIKAGLARYSRLRPLYVIYGVETENLKQDYEIPSTIEVGDGDDKGEYSIISISDCIYAPSGLTGSPRFQASLPVWWGLSAGEFYVFDQPTIGYVWSAQLKHMLDMFGGHWKSYEGADGKLYLRLIPAPVAVHTIPVELRVGRPPTRVLASDMDIFHLCVLIESHRAMSGRVGVAQSFSDSGMSLDLGRGAEYHAQRAAELEQLLAARTGNFAVGLRSG